MNCRLEGVVLGNLVKKPGDRDLTIARKSKENSSSPTYDSHMDQGSSGSIIQTTDTLTLPMYIYDEPFSGQSPHLPHTSTLVSPPR